MNELTSVGDRVAWHVPDAVVALDWDGRHRLLAVSADGSTYVDGTPRIVGVPGGLAVAGCWAGPSRHVVGLHDGTLVVDNAAPFRDAPLLGGLTALAWSGTALLHAHREQLAVFGRGSAKCVVEPRAGTIRAVTPLAASYIAVGGSEAVTFVDITTGAVDVTVDLPGSVAVAVDAATRYVAVGTLDGAIHILTIGHEQHGRELTGYPDAVRRIAWTARCAGLLATADDEVTLWLLGPDGWSHEPLCAVAHSAAITSLAACASTPLAATGDADGRVCVWSLRDMCAPIWWHAGSHSVTALAWARDGSALAAGWSDGTVHVWSVELGLIA